MGSNWRLQIWCWFQTIWTFWSSMFYFWKGVDTTKPITPSQIPWHWPLLEAQLLARSTQGTLPKAWPVEAQNQNVLNWWRRRNSAHYCVLIDLDRAFKYSNLFFLVLISLLACILSAWSRKTHFWNAGAYMVVITWLHHCSNINKTIESIETHSWCCLGRYESPASYCPGCLLGITEWCLGAILRNACCRIILESESECHLPGFDWTLGMFFFGYEKLMVRWSDMVRLPTHQEVFNMKFNHFFRLPHGF